MSCRACEYWEEYENRPKKTSSRLGICARYPPRVITIRDDYSIDCRYPETEAYDHCGEYKRRGLESEYNGRLHEMRKIYADMEGFKPETAAEGYCLRIIEQMYKASLGED